MVSMRPIILKVQERFINEFTAAVTGRIVEIIPFFPFSLEEAAVVAHKFLLQLAIELRRPIDFSESVRRLIGHIDLTFVEDGRLSSNIADQYNRKLGARSLFNGVDAVRRQIFARYCEIDLDISESDNDGPMTQLTVELHRCSNSGVEEIVVSKG